MMIYSSNGSQPMPLRLFECFDCHSTWRRRSQTCPPCPFCTSSNVMMYTNERTAALEAAGLVEENR